MNKPLTQDQKEKIQEIYEFGHFMKAVLTYQTDYAGNELCEEDVLTIIEAEDDLDLFSNYNYESENCELCGSHGKVSIDINNKLL